MMGFLKRNGRLEAVFRRKAAKNAPKGAALTALLALKPRS
jgi:hypothetical protein